MKKNLLMLAFAFVASAAFAATEEETLHAYTRVADAYPRLVLSLLQKNQDTVACQKAKVLDLAREAYESAYGKKLAKYNPWVYRNFTRSFGELKVVMNFCFQRADRASALRAAQSMAGRSAEESVGGN